MSFRANAQSGRGSRLSFNSFRLSDLDSATEDEFRTSARLPTDPEEVSLQARQIRPVRLAKRLLFLGLLVTAGVVCYFTYVRAHRQQEDTYRETFADLGTSVIQQMDESVSKLVAYSESLATTYAYQTGWPNVTLREFDARSKIMSFDSVSFLPILQTDELRREWEQFASENQMLVQEVQEDMEDNLLGQGSTRRQLDGQLLINRTIEDGLYRLEGCDAVDDDEREPPFFPIWQQTPRNDSLLMFNEYSNWFSKAAIALRALTTLIKPSVSQLLWDDETTVCDPKKYVSPMGLLYYPIARLENETDILGAVSVGFRIEDFLKNSLPESTSYAVDVIVNNSCGQTFSYYVEGADAVFIDQGEVRSLPETEGLVVGREWRQLKISCVYETHVYPSSAFRAEMLTKQPMISTIIMASIFVCTFLAFIGYSMIVENRQEKLLRAATQTSAIVTQLFPQSVRDRMLRENSSAHQRRLTVPKTPKIRLKNFLADSPMKSEVQRLADPQDESDYTEPIADLFPHTTVLFADIAGFTAWSSEREPSQVFKLLESLYRKFDEVAHKLGVFKVETIGDCYVAVTGLPDPKPDHAVVCARFAFEILFHMNVLIKQLEGSLGPGTSDLSLRIGLHSGPVTAGVLRGEKSRFQLFGDTVNTSARMESCGFPNRVQCSAYTAKLIIDSGKGHWLTKREGLVSAKGKGEMETYWIKPRRSNGGVKHAREAFPDVPTMDQIEEQQMEQYTEALTVEATNAHNPKRRRRLSFTRGTPVPRWGSLQIESSSERPASASDADHRPLLTNKKARLVSWNVDVLLPLLTKIVASRKSSFHIGGRLSSASESSLDSISGSGQKYTTFNILGEVNEVINLPKFDSAAVLAESSQHIILDERVKGQLRDYVGCVAALYQEHPFHNFEHASHVTMSANKLLKRIIQPDHLENYNRNNNGAAEKVKQWKKIMLELHNSTYGISSGPLIQFAIVFAALIHDVDHSGVPNVQLVEEQAQVATRFDNKSVAEQNSFFLAWELLMEPEYEALRSCIYTTDAERKLFRQLLVNNVMATDILDKGQQTNRKNRWERAFTTTQPQAQDEQDMNRKATAVLEHIIQASDVAHTMQHWRIYCKWNEKLFCEMYTAFKKGRAEKDPSIGWYEGELWFFDNYILPLARKLSESGVFGVSSDEYLQYALENRDEWQAKGQQVCERMFYSARVQWERYQLQQMENSDAAAPFAPSE